MKKTLELSFEECKEYFNSGNEALKNIALKLFTENELRRNELKCFKDLVFVSGCYINEDSILMETGACCAIDKHKNIIPTINLGRAIQALIEILQLMQHEEYNGEPVEKWADWENDEQLKYGIYAYKNKLAKCTTYSNCSICFKTQEKRDKFLNTFRDLLEIAKPLL